MSGARALVLTYHAVASGSPPLRVEPDLFERHVAVLLESGAAVLTMSELADALGEETLPERAVAITFDDGIASVAEHAAPTLARAGLRATVFAVSGHVGGQSDWPTQPASAPRMPLLDAGALRRLSELGWEIGSHGRFHNPLGALAPEAVRDELTGSRYELEQVLGVPVRAFAFPYGSVPAGSGRALIEAGYAVACTTRLGHVSVGDDPLALPRVDVHYLRKPARLRAAVLGGLTTYLTVRRAAARARRLGLPDHRSPS